MPLINNEFDAHFLILLSFLAYYLTVLHVFDKVAYEAIQEFVLIATLSIQNGTWRNFSPAIVQTYIYKYFPLFNQYVFSFVVMITRKHWSNDVQTPSPCLSGLQSKELTGCDESIVFCSKLTLPTTPCSIPSASVVFLFSG